MVQYCKIAGLSVELNSFGRTVEQAKAYQSDHSSPVDIKISTEGIELDKLWGTLTLDDKEYLHTGLLFYRALVDFNGLLLHSSAIVVDEKAYLFTAPSGTGKSTHTSLWLNQFGGRAYILNDDKPALRLEDGIWYAYGTPWSGKHDLSRNERVPLAGIAVVERAESNSIEPFVGVEAIHAIIEETCRGVTAEFRMKMLVLVNKLITQVPIWKLRCNKDPDAAIVSYEAMSGQKFKKEIEE